jgi:hypothetical protein
MFLSAETYVGGGSRKIQKKAIVLTAGTALFCQPASVMLCAPKKDSLVLLFK